MSIDSPDANAEGQTADNFRKLISKLHPLERQVVPLLKENKSLEEISTAARLSEIEVTRALQWLENKKVLVIKTIAKKVVILDKNGLRYKKEGLPEKAFLSVLDDKYKGLNVIAKKSRLSREEVNACLGLLRKKQAIEIDNADPKEGLKVRLTAEGQKLLEKKSLEERFLEKDFPLDAESLEDVDRYSLAELKKRKDFLRVEEKKEISIELTELGKDLVDADLGGAVVNRLTTNMLKTGNWKDKQFRYYDVEINVPKINMGKKHFVTQALEYAKNIWIEMGFKEMEGNMVNTSFWNFDALFTAQDHPVREMQDTYYLGGRFEKGNLPSAKLVQKVRLTHEKGGRTKSKGWQYSWDKEEAKRNVLRTHTTVLSAQTLAQLKKEDLPAKFFALGRCFRNEALDWKHLFEFNQTEGIVIDKNANFKHLLGYLKQFFKKMGYPQARFRPAFFPYTEPSVEIDVFHPVRKEWVELGGAGIFRPEVVVPLLGKDVPVLAWGPGFDRTILEYYNITDIRDLYKNDLKQIKEMKQWMK